jgi:pimeloyl-ACP methyl ester carboxylesterase
LEFIYGTIGGYDQLQPMVTLLDPETYQFIFVSHPGYLRTPLSTGVTFKEQADTYAALPDDLGIDQVALIAMSGGGPSALQFALRHQHHCWGMFMISASADFQAGRADNTSEQSIKLVQQPPSAVTKIIFSDFAGWTIINATKLVSRQFLIVMVGKDYVEAVLNNPASRSLYNELMDCLALLS